MLHRLAVMIVGESAKLLEQDVSSLAFNKINIQRQKEKQRKALATMLQQNFRRDTALVSHGDGKLLPDLTGRAVVDLWSIDCQFLFHLVIRKHSFWQRHRFMQ